MPTRDDWPDKSAPYEFRATGQADQERWQAGIDEALDKRVLKWHRTESPDEHDIRGDCPRCGHEMDDRVVFKWIGVDRVDRISQNIVCNCTEAHEPRAEGKWGCGWAPALEVWLDVPTENDLND
jgi:hypothetical protein